MQDVPRGFTSACRRACLSIAVGCLFAESPLYHFNAPIGYDNCSIMYVLDTHENSVNGRVRSRMRDNGLQRQAITDESEFSPRCSISRSKGARNGEIPITAS